MNGEKLNFDEFDLNFQETEKEEEIQEPSGGAGAPAEDPKEDSVEIDENPDEPGEEQPEGDGPEPEPGDEPEPSDEEEEEGEQPDPENIPENLSEGELTFTPYAQALFEVNGWEWDDALMETNSLESFNSLIKNIIDVNVKQQAEGNNPFATDQLQRVNDLVSKGADPKDAFSAVYDALDYDKVDLKNTTAQEKVAREYLQKTTRFSEERINKEIEKAKDLDELEELATEGIGALKELKVDADKDLEKALEQEAAAKEVARQKALDDTVAGIHKSEKIAGYKMDKKLATEFSEYISKADEKTGKTAYQAFIEKNPNWQIEAAMLAFKRMDKAKADKMDESAAVKLLKERVLGTKGKPKSSSGNKKPNRIVPSGENPAAKNKVDFDDFVL